LARSALRIEDVDPTDLRSLADCLLEKTRAEIVDEGVLLVMNPPGFEHRRIVESISRAFYASLSARWFVYSQDFQWDVPDGRGRFFVPDIVVVQPGAQTPEEEREAIALVVEVTSPSSPGTVLNDRETKPREYAKAGIPLYLLVDQEPAEWTLYAQAEGWQRYQIAASGKYGDMIPLPAPFAFEVPTADWPRY
jgi:Uma2 family endonuclease